MSTATKTLTKILIFASGEAEPGKGGSGFQKLFEATRGDNPTLEADIVGVVSNHENGGVKTKADALGIKFIYFPKPWSAEEYQRIARESGASFFFLSGWLPKVVGIDARTSFRSNRIVNVHPAPLDDKDRRFGGKGMYGIHAHEAVHRAFLNKELTMTGMSMHYVVEEVDGGPIICFMRTNILDDDTPASIQKAVGRIEHRWQPIITNKVIKGDIYWDGKPGSPVHGAMTSMKPIGRAALETW